MNAEAIRDAVFDETNGEADLVNHPPHYLTHPSGVECIEITRWMTFDVGNAVKYVYRADHKNGRQDIEKAIWYLRDALRHAVLPFILGGYSKATPELHRVVKFETDPNRLCFYRAILDGDLNAAVSAATAMLG